MVDGWGFNTPRQRRLWHFANTYKAKNAELYGLGRRNFIAVSIDGSRSQAFDISLVLDQSLTGSDLRLLFLHEWGHMYDKYMLTPAIRQTLLDSYGDPTQGDWTGKRLGYFDRPAEHFAWAYQRLFDPTLEDLYFDRESLHSLLPDPDPIWVGEGFELDPD